MAVRVVHAFFIFYQVSASSHTLLITSIYFIDYDKRID